MTRRLLWTGLGATLLVSGGWAFLQGSRAHRAGVQLQAALEREHEIARLIGKLPRPVDATRRGTLPTSIKVLAQEQAQSEGLSIAYLSENEREAGRGIREQQITLRFSKPGHPTLVKFLAAVEAKAPGHKVKEIHLRPSSDSCDLYEDVEIVLARRFAAESTP